MALSSITTGNFKGVADSVSVPIKPVTIFIGANSSGKSTVMHSMAALAQTVTLPNNRRPLVLDDEFAYVHLGRFIEIIHSKNYDDVIELGFSCDPVRIFVYEDGKMVPKTAVPTATYKFKSTKRTQDVYLSQAEISFDDIKYIVSKSKTGYLLQREGNYRPIRVSLESGFSFDRRVPFIGREIHYTYTPFFNIQRQLEDELKKTYYLGPFRQPPIRRYPTRGSDPREVGPRGEATVTLLANEMVQTKNRKHIKQVSEWFLKMGLAQNLKVSRVGGSDLFDVNITLGDGGKFPLADLGYGFSQILPVLTQLSFAPEKATLLFEQPELHLHTMAVRPLARVFIDAVKQKGLHIVAETHSRELFGEFIREMRAGNFSLDDFVAYRVSRENGCSMITPIEIDPETFDVYQEWENGITK